MRQDDQHQPSWRQLAELAADESNSERLLEIVEELLRTLESSPKLEAVSRP
jgi:hypothetical protein